jgi:hypothetical protein
MDSETINNDQSMIMSHLPSIDPKLSLPGDFQLDVAARKIQSIFRQAVAIARFIEETSMSQMPSQSHVAVSCSPGRSRVGSPGSEVSEHISSKR